MVNNRKINQICKPDFLGIGAPRTATTWLSHCLSKHSKVYIPPIEGLTYEVHYFDRCQSTTASFLRRCFLNTTTVHERNNKRDPYRRSMANILRYYGGFFTTIRAICAFPLVDLPIPTLSDINAEEH